MHEKDSFVQNELFLRNKHKKCYIHTLRVTSYLKYFFSNIQLKNREILEGLFDYVFENCF